MCQDTKTILVTIVDKIKYMNYVINIPLRKFTVENFKKYIKFTIKKT